MQTIEWLLDPDFFRESAESRELKEVKEPAESVSAVIELGKRLKGFVENGRLQLSVPLDSPIGDTPLEPFPSVIPIETCRERYTRAS